MRIDARKFFCIGIHLDPGAAEFVYYTEILLMLTLAEA